MQPSEHSAYVVCVGNQKGGVGKATTCVQLAGAFAERDARCLIIDLDMTAGATKSFYTPTQGWPQIIALCRAVYFGCQHPLLAMPAREGHLFDPDRYPFLEGQTLPEKKLPLVPDGTIERVLRKLLLLDGQRISYRTLDVEQIGSVYETMMGFRLEQTTGTTIALKPAKAHGAPVPVNLDDLLKTKPLARSTRRPPRCWRVTRPSRSQWTATPTASAGLSWPHSTRSRTCPNRSRRSRLPGPARTSLSWRPAGRETSAEHRTTEILRDSTVTTKRRR